MSKVEFVCLIVTAIVMAADLLAPDPGGLIGARGGSPLQSRG